MACSNYTFKGIASQCKDSAGGIKKVWVAGNRDAVMEGVTVASDVLSIKDELIADNFKVFSLRKNTSNATTTLNVSDNAGNSYGTDLVLDFLKQETAKRAEILGLCMSETVAVYKDGNGKYWFLGYDFPVEASAMTAETGSSMTDKNGYSITLHDDSTTMPFEITDASTIKALEDIVIA